MKAFMATIREEHNSWRHMLGTQNAFSQGFNTSNYQIWLEIWGWGLKKLPLEGF